MKKILITYAADGAATAEALAACVRGTKTDAWLWRQGASEMNTKYFHQSLEASLQVVFVITPDWNSVFWPAIERYILNAFGSSAAFLAKLVLVDLSNGAVVPALLRPFLRAGLSFNAAQALDYFAARPQVSHSRSGANRVPGTPTFWPVPGNALPARQVFVIGHPGSGKSAFCALFKSRFDLLRTPVAKIDAYSYLQVLFRIDQLKQDSSRFAHDELYEFVIKDLSVLDETISLIKQRLLVQNNVASGVTVVELAISESDSLTDLIEAHPRAIIVHIDAPLAACRDRNAARGARLARSLRTATSYIDAYDTDSDVHFVPPRYYDPYIENPSKWEAGATQLVKHFGDRYYRIDNAHSNLLQYMASCKAFIDTVIRVTSPECKRSTEGLPGQGLRTR